MDAARRVCDKILSQVENKMSDIYSNDPELKRIEKKLLKYMQRVRRETLELYTEYKNASPENKVAAKNAYAEAVYLRTVGSMEYNAIINAFVRQITATNQKAVNAVNAVMPFVYAVSYNQVSEQCKEVGIKVIESNE